MNLHDVNEPKMIQLQKIGSWAKAQETVYLYGAGTVCKKLLRFFEWHNYKSKVQGIFVTQEFVDAQFIHNVPVKPISEFDISMPGVILVAVSDFLRDEIICEIKKRKIANYAYVENGLEAFLDAELRKIKREESFLNIERISKNRKTNQNTDILFLTPPYWDLYAPFSAVPCLIAVLKAKEYCAGQIDLGIETVHYCLRKHWETARRHCLSQDFYDDAIMDYRHNPYTSYKAYCDDMWFLQTDVFDFEAVRSHYKSFNQVQRRVLDALYQFIYLLGRVDADFNNMESIQDALDQWDATDFLEMLSEERIALRLSNLPNIIGISITSREQFLPACLLALLCRRLKPDIKIIMGGSCADVFMNSTYLSKQDIYRYFDYVIIGEGETAIVKLVENLTKKNADITSNVPNLMRIGKDGKVYVSRQIMEDVETLPAPDYSGLDLSMYLAPEPILPYQASRGCHYGFCAFCNHDEKYRHNYRTKSAKKVVQDMLEISRRFGVKNFQFVDEAIRPDHFREIVDEMDLYDEFKTFKWIFYSRVSREYNALLLQKAKRNGCEMVMFGVETLNQRLLNFIKKGILAEVSKENLKLFHENGIKTFAWLMCNLPSETLEEAKKDLEDVINMAGFMDAFSVGMFFLDRNTDMSKEPEKFNITKVNHGNPFMFESHFNGKIVDKTSMIEFFREKYTAYQRKHFSCGNRYTLFFS